MHHDVSISNIMCTIKKGDNVFLEDGTRVIANGPTILSNKNPSLPEAFLNDYDLAAYKFKASGLTNLTGIWAFIAPSRLQGWGVHHGRQDVSLVLCVMWMACLAPAGEQKWQAKVPSRPPPPVASSSIMRGGYLPVGRLVRAFKRWII